MAEKDFARRLGAGCLRLDAGSLRQHRPTGLRTARLQLRAGLGACGGACVARHRALALRADTGASNNPLRNQCRRLRTGAGMRKRCVKRKPSLGRLNLKSLPDKRATAVAIDGGGIKG